ncbi:cysteine-rich receptor-like protein kinase 15 [Panicum miliaceum]|uniref:Cysteine-rich receptor-like protein kinase 15 n=1 Tax=Panicum miliaceum TaxID=4540 RepID=A0A3L6PK90_PANMI|nr:cysteine-rich receptor-like protein kinase 15 [Panicum miliaceum]
MLPGWDSLNQAQTKNITQIFRSMLTGIVGQVLSMTAHYAAIHVDTDDGISNNVVPGLYCLAQCAPDLVEDLCYNCLTNFSDLAAANFAGRCNLRYDTDKFFAGEPTWSSGSSSAAPSPAPQLAPLPPLSERRSRQTFPFFNIIY